MKAVDFFKRSLFPIKVTSQNLVYLGNENCLVSLPFFDPQIADRIIGFDIEGTCFLIHKVKSNMAPYVLNSNVAEYLKAKEVEVFGSELRALELPTMSDLTNWSKFDRFVSQTLYTAESGKGRCENGLYFSREGKCVKIRHGKVTSYFTEDTCRVLPVIPLCEEDFIGRLSGGEAVVQKIIDELFKLKSV